MDITQYLRTLSADCDRAAWVEIGGAFKSAGGDFEAFDQWSATAPAKYNAADCRTAWNSLAPSGNAPGAAGWLRKAAKEAGGYFPDEPRQPRPSGIRLVTGTRPPSAAIPPPPPPLPDKEASRAPSHPLAGEWRNNLDGAGLLEYIERMAKNRAEAEKYFCDERGLSPEIVTAFQLGFDPNDRAAVIPYPGELYCVRRFTAFEADSHGGAKYDNPRGQKRVFNAAALQLPRPVFICEGQVDALSIADAGGAACTGLNEPGVFLPLAKVSTASGFLLVQDQDEHGAAVCNALKKKLDAAGKKCEIAVMPPGIADPNELLVKQGRDALAAWIASDEKRIAPEQIAEAVTLRELQEKIEAEGAADPNELIKDRFLCRGGAGILAAETGCGKSSLIMQLCLHWGAGLPCFGLTPTQPLKILIIQAENDDRDLHEEISGVCWGAANIELLAFPQIAAAKENVKIISDATHAGDSFIEMLYNVLGKEKEIDLVICDPLFAFAGCDLSDQEKVSRFLRNQVNPLLKQHNAAAIFVHHMAKSSRAPMLNVNFNQAYNYHGSGEVVNWARFALVLERFKDRDGGFFFKLSAPKRGRRLGWEAKYLRWSDRAIYWEELDAPPELASAPEIATPEARAEQKERDKKRRLFEDAERAAEILQGGESMTAADFRRAITGRQITSNKGRIELILAVCIENKLLIERNPTTAEKTSPGVRKMIERPAEPPEQMAFF